MLSALQIQQFQEQGYLIVKNLVTASFRNILRNYVHNHLIKRLEERWSREQRKTLLNNTSTTYREREKKRRCMRLFQEVEVFLNESAVDPYGNLTIPFSSAINYIGHILHAVDPLFIEFSFAHQINRIVESLGHKKPMVCQSTYFIKHPGKSGEVCWHQDQEYFYTSPKPSLGIWFALNDTKSANVAVNIIPGFHKEEKLKYRWVRDQDGVRHQELNPSLNWDDFKATSLELPTDSMIIFNGYTPRCSPINRGNENREFYILRLFDQSDDYDKENFLQEPTKSNFYPLYVAPNSSPSQLFSTIKNCH